MIELIRREFFVDAPLPVAWQHLANVEQWSSWAKHIKRLELQPSGELTPESTGTIHLTNGLKTRFQMSELNLHQNWKWVGPFLWMTIHYDHLFEQVDDQRIKMIFLVEAEGFRVAIVGRLFAYIYNGNRTRHSLSHASAPSGRSSL